MFRRIAALPPKAITRRYRPAMEDAPRWHPHALVRFLYGWPIVMGRWEARVKPFTKACRAGLMWLTYTAGVTNGAYVRYFTYRKMKTYNKRKANEARRSTRGKSAPADPNR